MDAGGGAPVPVKRPKRTRFPPQRSHHLHTGDPPDHGVNSGRCFPDGQQWGFIQHHGESNGKVKQDTVYVSCLRRNHRADDER